MRTFFNILLILIVILGLPTSAQFVFDDELDQVQETEQQSVGGASIGVSPQIPAPNSTVTATVRDYSTDLSQTTIIWRVNGSEVARGIGLTSTTITIGDSGVTTTISVIAQNSSGSTVSSASYQLSPAEVDIVWTANTQTPPLYKGKSLYSPQSSITLAAIPQFPNNSNLIYTWRKGNTVLGNQSGTNRNTLTLTGSLLGGTQSISVDVLSADKRVRAQSSVVITPTDVDVVVYQNDDYSRAISNTYNLETPEITLRAVPYYISSPSAQYSWTVNGEVASNTDTVNLRVEPGQSGRSQIDVSVEHIQNFLQNARESFIINFAQ